MKILNKSKKLFFLPLCIVVFIISCKKDRSVLVKDADKSDIVKSARISLWVPNLEPVDLKLIEKYIDYQMQIEAINLIKNSGRKVPVNSIIIKKVEFDKMIDNFLSNERNGMRQSYFIEHSNTLGGLLRRVIDTSTLANVTLVCTSSFIDINSYSTVLFQTNVLYGTTLSASSFIFDSGGGTMTPTNQLIQFVSNGVITYKQFYQETFTLPSGGKGHQLYVMYGNVYHGACTVNGMKVFSQQ